MGMINESSAPVEFLSYIERKLYADVRAYPGSKYLQDDLYLIQVLRSVRGASQNGRL